MRAGELPEVVNVHFAEVRKPGYVFEKFSTVQDRHGASPRIVTHRDRAAGEDQSDSRFAVTHAVNVDCRRARERGIAESSKATIGEQK